VNVKIDESWCVHIFSTSVYRFFAMLTYYVSSGTLNPMHSLGGCVTALRHWYLYLLHAKERVACF